MLCRMKNKELYKWSLQKQPVKTQYLWDCVWERCVEVSRLNVYFVHVREGCCIKYHFNHKSISPVVSHGPCHVVIPKAACYNTTFPHLHIRNMQNLLNRVIFGAMNKHSSPFSKHTRRLRSLRCSQPLQKRNNDYHLTHTHLPRYEEHQYTCTFMNFSKHSNLMWQEHNA